MVSSTKAKVAAAFWPAKADSTMASLEMKPAVPRMVSGMPTPRSEEHTSELQSRRDLVCRLLLEKKKKKDKKLAEDPLTDTFNSYQKAIELDEYDKFSNSVNIKLTLLTNDLTNLSADALNENDYL